MNGSYYKIMSLYDWYCTSVIFLGKKQMCIFHVLSLYYISIVFHLLLLQFLGPMSDNVPFCEKITMNKKEKRKLNTKQKRIA